MLQITPQMRILVAIEAVDGRNYAPPNNMRSSHKVDTAIRRFLPSQPSFLKVELRIT
jgi:hypothetical protein